MLPSLGQYFSVTEGGRVVCNQSCQHERTLKYSTQILLRVKFVTENDLKSAKPAISL